MRVQIPRNMDWTCEAHVVLLAEAMGPGMTVVRRLERDSYNIIHTENEARLLAGRTIVHRTGASA